MKLQKLWSKKSWPAKPYQTYIYEQLMAPPYPTKLWINKSWPAYLHQAYKLRSYGLLDPTQKIDGSPNKHSH